MFVYKHTRVLLSVLFLVLHPGDKRKRDEVSDDEGDNASESESEGGNASEGESEGGSSSEGQSEGGNSSDDFDDVDDVFADEKWFTGVREKVDSLEFPDIQEESDWKAKDEAAKIAEEWAVREMDDERIRKRVTKEYQKKFDEHSSCFSVLSSKLSSFVAGLPKELKESLEALMTPRVKDTWSFLPLVLFNHFWEWQKSSIVVHVPSDKISPKTLFRAVFFNADCGFGRFLVHFNYLPYLLSFHHRCMAASHSQTSNSLLFDDMARFSYRLADGACYFLQGKRVFCSLMYVERCFHYIFVYKKTFGDESDLITESSEADQEVSKTLLLPTAKDLFNRVRKSIPAVNFDHYCGLILLFLSMPGMFQVLREDSDQLNAFKVSLRTFLTKTQALADGEAEKTADEIIGDIIDRRYSDDEFIQVAQGLVEHLFIRPFTRGVLFKLPTPLRQSRLETFLSRV
ncbi:hypothetical protein GUITHDRAFT_121653 [Guillardia theta CCMP2712]|uniref:Uncharacterized protein n=1 Tax=Guillardia theta (strain CCMP2712) TaxID=905079 RepID=L1I8D5_GUITC|nr:hypothetical protein GUITHDRAFT_121653 [Guillardia theta CCMP2712]EKX32159.1 hypothetical protein GUITHDRAFT_121653 [Guillardia theta CCMP2712]|eukprot:XP_005819139.1 hypothetical protein GUITHDRAFT_121653 [Guillardia theta CCMP2712]